jgi:hypothetical protein
MIIWLQWQGQANTAGSREARAGPAAKVNATWARGEAG